MEKIKVLFVCLGNICRSPMAEAIFTHKVAAKGIAMFFEADSAGTANYHVGKKADSRTISTVERMGLSITHAARQVSKPDLSYYNYILAMDTENRKILHRLAEADQSLEERIYLMRDFEPTAQSQIKNNESQSYTNAESHTDQPHRSLTSNLSVPDPYYGGESGFQEVYDILDRSIENLLDFIIGEHKLQSYVR